MEKTPQTARIRFYCDVCGQVLYSSEEHSGRQGKCACGNPVIVPYGYPSPTADNPFRGTILVGCRIDHVIGKGSSAAVYKGQHLVLDLPVAIKILDGSLINGDKDVAERFLHEAKIIAKMHQPNIVSVINAGEENGNYYIITRYLPGSSLGRILRKQGAIPLKKMCKVFLDVCGALRTAHSLGIVHGDVKPDHVIIAPRWRAALIDFGLVQSLRHYEMDARVRKAIGTPTYMSPEQAKGEHYCDVRSDLYSLGATMYHAVTGRPPFQGTSLANLLRKHALEPLVPPRELSLQIPHEISDLVCKAMEKLPEDRFQSVDQLRKALYKIYVNLGTDD